MLPSLSVTAGYQRLSELPASSFEVTPGVSMTLPESLLNTFTFGLNLQYPVFAGFRFREAAAIASLQTQGKLVGLEMVKRSLMFETRRAYWEAVRAENNVLMLRKNLELTVENAQLTANQLAHGAATDADRLAAEQRRTQAGIDLNDGTVMQKRALLSLAVLLGLVTADAPATGTQPVPVPVSLPGDEVKAVLAENLDEASLVALALARRPETRSSSLARDIAEHSARLGRAPLYPTVTLTGNVTLADPNPRVGFQTDPWTFTATWSLGILVSYDLGGLPANLVDASSQDAAAKKATFDDKRQRNLVAMDVRGCLLSLERIRSNIGRIAALVDQTRENLRVTGKRFDAGAAVATDVLAAKLSALRAEFAVTNLQIDALIAYADLERATARDELR
jgi:outer membrane protein TolC